MIYNYNPDVLILQADLIRAVRQMASQVVAIPLVSTTPALDREQVLQAISLACADLDDADPLIVEHIIDTSAYVGRAEPVIPNAIPATRPNVFALYMPAVIDQDNLIEWDWSGPTGIIPHTAITANSPCGTLASRSDACRMLALIRWPYSASALAEVNPGVPPTGNRTPVAAYAADPNTPLVYAFDLPVVDGRVINIGERVLIGNGEDSNLTGIYTLVHSNENEYTFRRPADCDNELEIAGSIVAVQSGSAHAGTVWQIVAAGDPPGYYHITPITGTREAYIVYRANITRDQATATLIPRAAAYLVHQVALAAPSTVDKTAGQHLIDWATAILARPIPAASQAISYRIRSATQYSNT